MVQVSRTFKVNRPIEAVAAYLRDFAHAADWDPGTQRCERIGHDPVSVGTQWHNDTKLFGISTSLIYTLTVDQPDHVVLTGDNKSVTSTEDLRLRAIDERRTEVTYNANLKFNGFAKITDPLWQLGFNRLADEVPGQMTRAIETAV